MHASDRRRSTMIRRVGDAEGRDRRRGGDSRNDALIGLEARRHGATGVTAEHSDFETLSRALRIAVLDV
jgi:predicted nucleic acid-binding protein